MDVLDIEKLGDFVSSPIEISIVGETGEDQAPTVKKMLFKMESCPDRTHIRLYFDHYYFLAIPITSEVRWNEDEVVAYDSKAKLHYWVRKGK